MGNPNVPDNWFVTLEDRIWLPPDAQGKEEADFIRKALRLRRGQCVLDAPCGAGRVAYHMAQAGLIVEGIDIRRQFISRAQQRFRQAGIDGRFRVLDLRTFDDESAFHAIYTWHGSFGYFADEENLELVQRFARALRPGGRVLIEQVNRERVLRGWRHTAEQGSVISHNEWNAATQRAISRRIIDGVSDPANWSSMRLYTPSQMKALLRKAGLEPAEPIAWPKGGPVTRSCHRIAYIGRRPHKQKAQP